MSCSTKKMMSVSSIEFAFVVVLVKDVHIVHT
jgi:hypothetical protein